MKRISIFIPTMRPGGAEKQAAILASLLSHEFDVTLIVFHGEMGIDARNYEYLKDTSINSLLLTGSLLHKIKLLYRKFKETEVLFNYLTFCNFLGGLVAGLCKVEKIYSGVRCSELPYWKIILEKIGARTANKVIFNSYFGKTMLGDKISEREKQIAIPNCLISESKFIAKSDRHIKNIVTVARFVPDKDFETALRSIKALSEIRKDFIYVIVGYGELENVIRKMITDFELEKYVRMVIKPDNVSEYLNSADIYLSTSNFEGTSNSILEAMDAGLPIVATNVGDAQYMISPKNGFLTNPGDFGTIAADLSKLLGSLDLRNEKGQNSFEIARSQFSHPVFLKNYLTLIDS